MDKYSLSARLRLGVYAGAAITCLSVVAQAATLAPITADSAGGWSQKVKNTDGSPARVCIVPVGSPSVFLGCTDQVPAGAEALIPSVMGTGLSTQNIQAISSNSAGSSTPSIDIRPVNRGQAPPVAGLTTAPATLSFTGVMNGPRPGPLNLNVHGGAWSSQDTCTWVDASPTAGVSGSSQILQPSSGWDALGIGTVTCPITYTSAGKPNLVKQISATKTSSAPPPPPAGQCMNGTRCDGTNVNGTVGQSVCGTNLTIWDCTTTGWRNTEVACTCGTPPPPAPRCGDLVKNGTEACDGTSGCALPAICATDCMACVNAPPPPPLLPNLCKSSGTDIMRCTPDPVAIGAKNCARTETFKLIPCQ